MAAAGVSGPGTRPPHDHADAARGEALCDAAELLRDTLADAHLRPSPDSALTIAHAKLIAGLERGEGVVIAAAPAPSSRP
jgi:hypothetical protein